MLADRIVEYYPVVSIFVTVLIFLTILHYSDRVATLLPIPSLKKAAKKKGPTTAEETATMAIGEMNKKRRRSVSAMQVN